MIDSHAHLYIDQFDEDKEDVIQRSKDQLSSVINIGIDVNTSKEVVRIARSDSFFKAVIGLHPEDGAELQGEDVDDSLSILADLVEDDADQLIVGIGEIGLDYSRLPEDSSGVIQAQKNLFRKQCDFAQSYDLPIVIHSRDAFEDTIEIIKEMNPVGVWHSFTGNREEMEHVLESSLYIGVNGIVTFPSAKELSAAVREIPLDRLILETDCPFLAPQEYRGQRCEPWMVVSVADFIADLKGVSVDEIDRITTYNAEQIFGVELN